MCLNKQLPCKIDNKGSYEIVRKKEPFLIIKLLPQLYKMTRIGQVRGENTAFVNNFWGRNDTGFRVVQTKMNDALNTLQELLDFYKERIQVEKDYNKKLERLNSKIILGSHETGTLKKSLDKLSLENKQMVKDNSKFIKTASQMNYDKLNHFYSVYCKKISKIEQHMQKIINKQRDAQKSLEVSKNKYQEECSQIKSLLLLTQTTWGKELEKNEAKLNKLESSTSGTKKHYQIAITKYQDLNEIFIRDWSIALQDFYQLEIERIQICKINCFNFCNNIATLCVDNDQSVDLARAVFAQVSPAQDLQDFGDTYGAGDRIYKPPSFIDFMNGYDDVEKDSDFTVAEFENPDYNHLLSRSYSSYSQASHGSSPKQTCNKQLPPVNEMLSNTNLPPPSSHTLPVTSPKHMTVPPGRKPPTSFDRSGSVYSTNEENKNDIFSIADKEKSHKFNNSNGSSNYSNPTNYTNSNYSSTSNNERNWASPRRKEKQLNQFQEQINIRSKELPSFPANQQTTTNDSEQRVPIMKDFSIDFIAKALEDLNSGGDGDINQYRRSVRGDANPDGNRAQTAPSTPFGNSRMKPRSDYVDDHDEVATRHESIKFNPTSSQQYRGADLNGSPVKSGRRKTRPKSMLDPITTNTHLGYDIGDEQEDTCIIRKPSDQSQTPNSKPRRTLLKSPTKSYTNLHAMIDQPTNNEITPVGKNSYVSKAKALYTYKPQHHGELYFKKGWFMYVIHKQEDDWFVCELADNCNDRAGMIGLVPGNYVSESNVIF